MKKTMLLSVMAVLLAVSASADPLIYDLSGWGTWWTVGPATWNGSSLDVTWTDPTIDGWGYGLVYPPVNLGSDLEFDIASTGTIFVAKITAENLPANPSGSQWSIPWNVTFFVNSTNGSAASITCCDPGDPLMDNPSLGWRYDFLNETGAAPGLIEGTYYYVMDLTKSESPYNSSWYQLDDAVGVSLWGLVFGGPIAGEALGDSNEPIIYSYTDYANIMANTTITIGAVYIGTDPSWRLPGDEAVPVRAGASIDLGDTVPDVSGMSQSEAQAELEAAGYLVDVTQESSDTVPPGGIIRTEPEGGAALASGSTVTLVISSGSAGTQLPVSAGVVSTMALAAVAAWAIRRRVA